MMKVPNDSDILIEISRGADLYIPNAKSHALQLGDALIAATAVEAGALLWTRNRKHYPMPEIHFFEGSLPTPSIH